MLPFPILVICLPLLHVKGAYFTPVYQDKDLTLPIFAEHQFLSDADSAALRLSRRRMMHELNQENLGELAILKTVAGFTAGLILDGITSLAHRGYKWITDETPDALFHACHYADLTALQAILQNGRIHVDTRNCSGETALMLAARDGFLDVVQALLAAHADPAAESRMKSCPLIYAVRGKNLEVFKCLMEAHQDPLAIESLDNDLRTPLTLSSYLGNTRLVQEVLVHKPFIDHQELSGSTALILAASEGRSEIVRLLLEAGASPHIRDNVGETALHRAAFRSHIKVCRLLLIAGADPLAKSNSGYCPGASAIHRPLMQGDLKRLLDAFINLRLIMRPDSALRQVLCLDVCRIIAGLLKDSTTMPLYDF